MTISRGAMVERIRLGPAMRSILPDMTGILLFTWSVPDSQTTWHSANLHAFSTPGSVIVVLSKSFWTSR